MPHLAICTVAAKNYVSFARTMCRSLQAHSPDVRCFTLLIDDWEQFVKPAEEPFEIVSLSDLQIPDLRQMTFKYDITEFSTAVKPYLLDYLLNTKKIDKLLYLDPDIFVLKPLVRLFDLLDENEFIVTPHIDEDYPDDGCWPSEREILVAGIYNLGFFGIRRSHASKRFLTWWCHKLSTKCVTDPAAGYFVDQRFIDLAVGLFPGFYIERDTGYNVAYWNLHSRQLRYQLGLWECNGRPLYFFHFSGFKPEIPECISKYSNRYTFISRPDIAPLFLTYKNLLDTNGYMEAYQWPYSFDKFATGETISSEMRLNYRKALHRGMQLEDPFRSRKVTEAAVRAVLPELVGPENPIVLKSIVRNLTPPVIWRCIGWSKRLLVNRRRSLPTQAKIL